ncbi:MAG: sensor histidine kinase [Candidatus Xenobiia bacterium LiM19]
MEHEHKNTTISLNQPVFFRKSFHNLRNPLVVIKGYTSLMLDGCGGDLSEDHKEWVVDMKQNCEHLLTIINTLSELSFIESGIWDEKAEDVDMAALLRDIAKNFEAQALSREIDIAIAAPENIQPLHCGRSLVTKAVENLMNNALLFSPKGGAVELSLSFAGEFLSISVKDTGPGFEEEKLPLVLEGYFQGEELPDGRKGTGLGILISRRIAERYGGALALESTQGKGSRFTMTLKK